MNVELLEQAMKVIPSPPILINAVSRRVRQLSMGHPALVRLPGAHPSFTDIALKEIIDGKIKVIEAPTEMPTAA